MTFPNSISNSNSIRTDDDHFTALENQLPRRGPAPVGLQHRQPGPVLLQHP